MYTYIYSERILSFIHGIKESIRKILTYEVGLSATTARFMDKQERFSFPISVIIYDDRPHLGYFDPSFFEMGFHACLMHQSKEALLSVIRHELAHYLVFIEQGHVQPHGPEFKAFCRKMCWDEEISKAALTLPSATQEDSDLLRKVKKLLALSSSSHENEAEQALLKSQQLLLKYHLDEKTLPNLDEEKVFLCRALVQPRKNAKMVAMTKILETFFVGVVFRKGYQNTTLEVIGSETNIKIASYVASVLERQLEELWESTKREHNLKGLLAKNSFFLGLATGYCDKVGALKKRASSHETQALILLDKALARAKALAYGKLSSTTSRNSTDEASALLGEQAGRSLNISQGVTHTSQETLLLN